MRKLTFLVLIAAASSQLGATGDGGCGPGDQVTQDPGFDLWCGDALCAWKVVAGEIKKAPTWHEKDAGVQFLGTYAAIEQTAPLDQYDQTCIKFSLLSRSEASAELTLEVDLYGDGSVEHTERFPSGDWQKLEYHLALAAPFRGVRFAITKAGAGSATVAQLDVKTAAGECVGFSEIHAEPAPLGALCAENADCASNRCTSNGVSEALYQPVCASCDPTDATTCGTDEVCGWAEPTAAIREPSYACAPKAADKVGARCRTNAECGSDECVGFVCSSCGASTDCPSGESCSVSYSMGPSVCSPHGHLRASGEPCSTDSDCTSGTCEGTPRYECSDGRTCGDANRVLCPPQFPGFSLEPGECTLVGIEGGSCS